jgi:hypothetical protein
MVMPVPSRLILRNRQRDAHKAAQRNLLPRRFFASEESPLALYVTSSRAACSTSAYAEKYSGVPQPGFLRAGDGNSRHQRDGCPRRIFFGCSIAIGCSAGGIHERRRDVAVHWPNGTLERFPGGRIFWQRSKANTAHHREVHTWSDLGGSYRSWFWRSLSSRRPPFKGISAQSRFVDAGSTERAYNGAKPSTAQIARRAVTSAGNERPPR